MKVTVMIPTYNEAATSRRSSRVVLRQSPDIDVLVVDDHSPDGTGRSSRDMAARTRRVRLFDRTGPRGRGYRRARRGFVRALESGADFVVEMDGDFSHAPRYIPRCLEKRARISVVLVRAFVGAAGKNGDVERTWLRRTTSLLPVTTSARCSASKASPTPPRLRCFSRAALQAIDVGNHARRRSFIVTEILFRCRRRGLGRWPRCRSCSKTAAKANQAGPENPPDQSAARRGPEDKRMDSSRMTGRARGGTCCWSWRRFVPAFLGLCHDLPNVFHMDVVKVVENRGAVPRTGPPFAPRTGDKPTAHMTFTR
jgi:dolichol-phosphate mannosyltransferase